MVFEDTQCIWHASPIDPLISDPVPLGTLAAADGVIADAALLGNPGSCTPIGDALVKAMDELGALGIADEPHSTIILMTDGIENRALCALGRRRPWSVFESRALHAGRFTAAFAFAMASGHTSSGRYALDALPLPGVPVHDPNPPDLAR